MDGTSHYGRAWRLATAAVILTIATLVSSAASAGQWVTKQIFWAGSTRDSTYMQGTADTTRTLSIDTTDWDWELMAKSTAAPATAFSGAHVRFVATASNQASDSLYYFVEHGDGDGKFETVGYLTRTAALGNCAVVLNPSTTPGRVFSGVLLADSDAVPYLAGNIWLSPQFRLQVHGDAGTTPILAGLRIFITYPRR